jgi:hypothetical protein
LRSDCIGLSVPQPTEWQRIGNSYDARSVKPGFAPVFSLLKIPVRKAFGSSVSALTFIGLSDVGYGRKLDCADRD